MAIAKIRVGDDVQVITGSDKGQVGKVMAIDGRKIKVAGVRLMKKHVKPNRQKDEAGGIKSLEAWLDHSNVVLYDTASQRPYSVGIREENSCRVRYDKRTGNTIHSGSSK